MVDGFGMPVEWALSIVVPIFKWKGNIRNCSCYGLEINSKEVEGGRCMRQGDVRLYFSGMERGKVWQDCMERITNEENDWDHV